MTKPAVNKDLRVSLTLGLTIPVETYGSVKPSISILEIDPSGDVEAQVELALNAAVVGFAKIDENLETLLSEIIAPITNTPSMKTKLDTLDEDLKKVKRNITTIASKIRSMAETLPVAAAQVIEEKE